MISPASNRIRKTHTFTAEAFFWQAIAAVSRPQSATAACDDLAAARRRDSP
jgi:hypothetical protein